MAGMTREQRREKADRTTGVATDIIRGEQEASAAKTARLRALRAERESATPEKAARQTGLIGARAARGEGRDCL